MSMFQIYPEIVYIFLSPLLPPYPTEKPPHPLHIFILAALPLIIQEVSKKTIKYESSAVPLLKIL